MQKSKQKIKITHNPTTKNNHIDVVMLLAYLSVHVYITEYKILRLPRYNYNRYKWTCGLSFGLDCP